MASTWLTDVADVVGGYYGRTQPKYNAARNREIAAANISKANGALDAMFASEFPDVNLGGQDNFKAREALLSGIPRGSLNPGPEPANPMLSQLPSIQAPEPVKAAAPMLTTPSLYQRDAVDVVRDLMPNGPGSASYKQSSSSAGASPKQADESAAGYRDAVNELSSKSKSLAINQARLEYMKQMAPAVKAQMFGSEEADAFDREVEKLSKEVEGDQAAQAKALAKKAELEQKTSTSRRQAELQEAKISVAREAKEAATGLREMIAMGRLDLDWAKLHMRNLQDSAKNMIDKYKAELNAWTSQGGTQQLFASKKVPEMMQHLTRGQALIDRLDAMRGATGGALLSQDRAQAAAALTEWFNGLDAMAQDNKFELMPEQPEPGFLEKLYGGGVTAQPVQQALPPSAQFLTGAVFDPIMGGGGSYSSSSASGSAAAPVQTAKPKTPKLGGKKSDGGAKKATSPKVGDKNAEGKTWTGKRWL